MTDTANLGLPCIEGSQAQKHVTHNDALRILDTLVQLAVLDRDLSAPPSSPAEGQRWIVKTAGTGAWAGHDNAIAAWQDGAWQFSAPQAGWVAFVADEGTLLVWNGAAWGDFFSTVTSIQNLSQLGIGTTADATNILSVKLNNALFTARTVAEGGDGTLRYKLSKERAAKTLSFLFQDNYSGRAEIGLTGDDDFHFKVSADGATWTESIKIAAATGKVSFPASGGPREVLGANRTYYVRTDGNDANSGLANSAGGAFLTLQKAVNVAAGLDFNGFTVTIQIGDGTYSGGALLSSPWLGGGVLQLAGNNATPSNVLIGTTGADAVKITCNLTGTLLVKDLKLQTATGGSGINHSGFGTLQFQNLVFGACATHQIFANSVGAHIMATGNYSISGGALSHLAVGGGFIEIQSRTVTLSGTPAFGFAFIFAAAPSLINIDGNTYSGAATGSRYGAQFNAVIYTASAGANYFPGNSVGSTSNGGQYI